MSEIERDEDGFVVPASVLGEAFGLAEEEVRQCMQNGTMTSRCEVGHGADEGRWRLIFRHKERGLRLTLNASGQILSRAKFADRRARRGCG
ncbi:DUF6522 family protein [Nisaea denitrificans]|uniref:DUF6522 family protein n=1 Tax=Nisaea denitrificans TaxID=390877 RepID=UPI0003F7A7B0|nr:DUF6522 family protein [Nisaea denitrificans]